MALRRVCDRCGVDVLGAVDLAATQRTVTAPSADASSAPVDGDFSITLSIQADRDLCPVCLSSVLVRYAKERIGREMTPATLSALSAQVGAVVVER